MPSKNVIRDLGADCFYHVYNRGVDKQLTFRDEQDYVMFLGILKRHLSNQPQHDSFGREYKDLSGYISLLSYCLMPNHFHLMVYNKEMEGLEHLMRSLATSYSLYFNKKHKRVGHLFQGRFKASRIDADDYLVHISRYIHRNPRDYKNYKYSSYIPLTKGWDVEWLDDKKFWETFDGTIKDYEAFVADYRDVKKTYKIIDAYLADS